MRLIPLGVNEHLLAKHCQRAKEAATAYPDSIYVVEEVRGACFSACPCNG
jgi:hypothetical protein